MADVTVTGSIGTENVELRNAASEATLLRLVQLMEKGPGGKSAGNKTAELGKKAQESLTESVKTSTKQSDIFNDKLKKATESTGKLSDAFERAGGVISSISSGIFSGIVAAGTGLVGFLQTSLDAFRETSAVGGAFNNSMIELQRTAAGANMPLGDFVKMVGQNSTTLAMFGGTVTQGAQRFAELSGSLSKSELGDRFRGMGLTMEDMNSGMLTYIDMISRTGALQKTNNKDLIAGSAVYLEEMDKLSKQTGLSRKVLEDQAKKDSIDPIINELRRGLNPRELAQSTANMAKLTQMGGQQLNDSMKSIAAGVPDEFGKLLMSAGVNQEKAMEIMQGKMNPTDLIKFMRTLRGTNLGQLAMQKEMLAAIPGLQGLATALNSAEAANLDAMDAAIEEQKKYEPLTNAVANFGNTINSIYQSIKAAILDSKVFEHMGNVIARFTEAFNRNRDRISAMFTRLIETFDRTFGNFGEDFDFDKIFDTVLGGFEKLFNDLIPQVGDFFRSLFGGFGGEARNNLSEEDKAKRTQLLRERDRLSRGETRTNAETGESHTIFDPDKDRKIADINKQLESLNGAAAGAAAGGGLLTNMFSGLTDKLKEVALYIGGGSALLIIGLYALSGGITSLLTPLGLLAAGIAALAVVAGFTGPEAMGTIFTGLSDLIKSFAPIIDSFGTLIQKTLSGFSEVLTSLTNPLKSFSDLVKNAFSGLADIIRSVSEPLNSFKGIIESTFSGVSKVIETFSNSFARIPTTLKELSSVSATDLIAVSGALVPLAASLTALGAPGLVGFFLGGSLDKLVETLTKFSSLNIDNLKGVGSVLKDFGKNVQDLWEGGSWIRGLTSNDGGLAAVGTALQSFNNVNADSIQRLSPVLRDFANGAKSLTEGGSWLKGLTGTDGGLSAIATALSSFNNINVDVIQKLAPVLKDFATGARSLTEGGNWLAGLTGNDGGLASIARSLKEFNDVRTENLMSLGPALSAFGNEIKNLTGGGTFSRFNENALIGLARGLLPFNNVNGQNLAALMPGLRSLIESSNSLSDIRVGNTQPLVGLAQSLTSFNTVNGENLKNVVNGIGQLKPVMDESFNRSNESVNTFIDSIKELNEQLSKLNENMNLPGANTAATGTATPNAVPTITSPVNTTEKLSNNITELVELTKLIRDNTKDTADAVKGRNRPI